MNKIYLLLTDSNIFVCYWSFLPTPELLARAVGLNTINEDNTTLAGKLLYSNIEVDGIIYKLVITSEGVVITDKLD
jgi:hypothetical protein